MPKKSVVLPDDLWDRMAKLGRRNGRSQAGEVRYGMEVYARLAESNHPAIREVMDGAPPTS